MPGVPKSRGCDACRKQRKKCDQRQPTCSRCARLSIPCCGSGVQRYVFLDNSGPEGKAKHFKQLLARRDAIESTPPRVIDSMPANRQDSMTALMVNKFSIKDLRYDVGWAFGPFIHEIPKRVGHSVALDFSARAFALSLPPSPHTRRHPGSDVLENLSAALKATRLALADPVESKSIHTLCAAYLLALCTDRIGTPQELSIHLEGIGHLLNNHDAVFDPSCEFDAAVVLMLCSMVNAERTLDTRLDASESSPLWQFFNTAKTQTIGPIQKSRSDLALYADLGRSLDGLSILTHEARPASETLLHFAGISSIIRQYRVIWQQSCDSLGISTADAVVPAEESHYSPETLRTHLRSIRDYCAALTLGLVMNMIVRMYLPPQEHALSETSRNFTAELIALAKQTSHFKPLGSAFMSPFLHTIWAAGDHDTRMALTSTLHLHQIDFDPRNAKFLSGRMNTLFHNMRARIAAQSSPNIRSSPFPPLPDPPAESIGLQRESELPARDLSWTISPPAARGPEPPTPATIAGDCSD